MEKKINFVKHVNITWVQNVEKLELNKKNCYITYYTFYMI